MEYNTVKSELEHIPIFIFILQRRGPVRVKDRKTNVVHFTHLLRPHSEGARPCFLSQLHSPLPEGKNRVLGSSHITSKHLQSVSCFPPSITEQGTTGKGRSFLRAELVLLLLM